MDVTLFLAEAHQPILFQCGEKDQVEPLNQLQVVGRGVPGIKEHGLGLDPFVGHGAEQHFTKMLVLGFAIRLGSINAKVNRPEVAILSRTVYQIDHANATDQPMLGAAVLALDQFDKPRVAFVLNTIIDNQKSVGTISEQMLNQFPQAACS